MEGGAEIKGKNMKFMANKLQLDDGAVIQVNSGGNVAKQGRGRNM